MAIAWEPGRKPTETGLGEEIVNICPPPIRTILGKMSSASLASLQELRFRQDRPLGVLIGEKSWFLSSGGELTCKPSSAYVVTKSDIERVFQSITRHSVYALEEELRNGYITVVGGHRVGFTGEAVVQNGKVKTLKNIACLNLRVAREIQGCSTKVLPWIIDRDSGLVRHTLIISPPKCGKTTLLRDIIRQLSNGIPALNFSGVNVGVVDERSELASCYQGVPQKDIGFRSDVLDRCPKAEGMYMLVRSMSPQVIVTDEIGRPEDMAAIREVLNAGIKLITSVHGTDLKDIVRRPVLNEIISLELFERFIILGSEEGAGTLEAVIDGSKNEGSEKYLYQRKPLRR